MALDVYDKVHFFLWHLGDSFGSKRKLCPTASIANKSYLTQICSDVLYKSSSVTVQIFHFFSSFLIRDPSVLSLERNTLYSP